MSLGLGLGLPFGRAKMIRFDPLTLFANGEQGAWYDPSDLSSMFQDAAGTIPVTADGDPVGLRLDKSGNGHHAFQTIPTARALYRTDGTRHWLEYDGVDDCYQTAAFAWGSDQMFSSFALRKNIDSAVGVFAEFGPNTVSTNATFAVFHSNTTSVNGFGVISRGTSQQTLTFESGFPAPVDAVVSAQLEISPASLILRANGTQRAASSSSMGSGNYGTHSLYLGARAETSLFLNGRSYGDLLINRHPTPAELAAIDRYHASKAGVVLP